MMGLVLANGAGAQPAPDSLALSRSEVTDRAIARAPELESLRGAVLSASSLTRIAALPSSPVLTLESEGSPSPFSSGEYTRRVGLEQEVDLRGHQGARRRVGQASIAVAERDLAAHEQLLGMAVDEVYGRWLLARRRLGFIGPLVARSAELSRRAESARRREVITGFDARVLKGDVAELEAEQLDALRELDEADAELKLRAGLPAGQPLRLDDDLDGGRWGCAVDSLTLIAQRSRADLARAGAAESLAASRVGFERRMSAPNLTLGVSAGREGRSFEGSAGTQRDESTILGIHATIPLPWGRSFGAVHEAQVELGRAQAERAGLDRTMREEVAVACAGLARAESRRELLRIAASSAAADLLLTESAYREGRIPLEQYLTVRERLVRIQREALDAVSAVEAGRARLVRATGLRRDVLAASLSSTER